MPKKKGSGVKPKNRTKADRKVRRRAHRRAMSATFPSARNLLGKAVTPTKRKKAAKGTYQNIFFD